MCANTLHCLFFFFFFNDTATTEIYTLSLHDALPISRIPYGGTSVPLLICGDRSKQPARRASCLFSAGLRPRSEEHTSELQSPCNLVCRLLLEKKKEHTTTVTTLQVTHEH